MIDKNLNGIVFSQSPRISKYSSVSIAKGLELAEKISSLNNIATPKIDNKKSEYKQSSSRYIWKCIDTIYSYSYEEAKYHISLSPNGKMFAVLSENYNDIDIWDVEKTILIKKIKCSDPSSFEFSHDSNQIIISKDTDLTIISIESGEIDRRIKFTSDSSISSDLCDASTAISTGLNLIAIYDENQIYIWSIKTGLLLHQIKFEQASNDKSLFIAHESPVLIVIVRDQFTSSKAEVWNPISGQFMYCFDFEFHPNLGTSLAFDGSVLFNHSDFVEIKSGCLIDNLDDDDFGFAYLEDDDRFLGSSASSFSQDGKTLVISGSGGAIKIFKKFSVDELLTLEPKDPEIKYQLVNKFTQLANKQYQFGDFKDAIDSYTTAIEIDPNNFQAYNRRSTARSALGDYQGAMEDFQKAREMN